MFKIVSNGLELKTNLHFKVRRIKGKWDWISKIPYFASMVAAESENDGRSKGYNIWCPKRFQKSDI